MTNNLSGTARDVEVNGIKLHTWTWGEFSDPTRAVLLIHGLTANSQSWVDLASYLAAQGWFVIAPDLRGRGLSDKPAHGYGVPYHANDLLGLCDAFGLPQVNIIGHSLGAIISLFLAAIHPGYVAKLGLVDAGGKIPDDTAQAIAGSLSRLGRQFPSLENYLDTMRQSPAYQWNASWEHYFRYDARQNEDGTVVSRVPKAAIDEEGRVMAASRLENLPTFIQTPTLIVRATVGMLGPDRGLVLPREEAERMKSLISGSRIVEIAGANHYTIISDEVFKQEIAAFLNQ